MNATADRAVSSPAARLVVFVGGFDPRGARHYHRLCAEQAQQQADVDGAQYQVSARAPLILDGPSAGECHRHARWSVTDVHAGSSEYVFFDWSDLVRANWPRSTWAVISQAVATYAAVWSIRASLQSLRAQAPQTLLTFLYPLAYGVMAFMVALLVFGAAWCLSAPWLATTPVGHSVCALLAAVLVLLGFAKLERLLHVSWLLRIFNFACASATDDRAVIDGRIRAMAHWIVQRQQRQPALEVVVIGFSVGSAQALWLSQAIRKAQSTAIFAEQVPAPSLTLLTLGNCVPLFALMPQTDAFREVLKDVGADAGLHWLDISAPSDSVSFGMCNLHQVSGAAKAHKSHKPLNPRHMCSPRFHKLFKPQNYRRLRRNKMRMHFQYLMASQERGAYNFFSMLTAPTTVRAYVEKYLVR